MTDDAKTGPRPDVAIFLRDLNGGGAERMMLNLASGMQAQGAGVELVVAVAEGALREIVPQGMPLVTFDCRRTLRSILPLARYLKRRRPRALLAAQVHVNVAAVLAGLLARARTRIAVSERNTTSIDRHASADLSVTLAHRLVPLLYRRADAIIAVSDGVADDCAAFARVSRSRIDVINNPVVTADFARRWDVPVDHPWFAAGAPPVVLGVGRLSPQKHFPLLIDAFARVRRDRAARLVILGEGPDRAGLEALVQSLAIAADVSLPGFVIDALPYMRRAAVLALSSRWEGSPNVLVEALACGTPVVATDCPYGPRETLNGGAYGGLVPVDDPDALAAAIAHALDAPPATALLQTRAQDFTMEAASARYLDVLLPDRRTTETNGS